MVYVCYTVYVKSGERWLYLIISEHRPEDILSDQDLAALVDRDNELPKSKAYTIVENVASEKY